MRMLGIDPLGLRLVLGGGLPLVSRAEGFAETAAILIRGQPGTGKSVSGLALAASIARALGGDVAYGCIELLPTELAAQHAQLGGTESVVISPFPQEAHAEAVAGRRIFAASLDVSGSAEAPERIVPALVAVLQEVRRCGGTPRVLVADSLSDGYGLGKRAPRALADELTKMAATEGVVLILLEEVVGEEPSVWSFVVDVVLGLGVEASSSPDHALVRTLTVLKNRFGPAELGPHRVVFGGPFTVEIQPNVRTYLRPQMVDLIFGKGTRPTPIGWTFSVPASGLPPFHESATYVFGNEARLVHDVTCRLGAGPDTMDLFLDLGLPHHAGRLEVLTTVARLPLGGPFLEPEPMVGRVVEALARLSKEGRRVARVVLGDLGALYVVGDDTGVKRALVTLLDVLRRLAVPTVMFQTHVYDTPGPYWMLADVWLRAINTGTPQGWVTVRRTQQETKCDDVNALMTNAPNAELFRLLS